MKQADTKESFTLSPQRLEKAAEAIRDLLKAEKIMIVCACCADNNPEYCGRYKADELRVGHDGRWLCEDCFDEEDETDLRFYEAPRLPFDLLSASLTERDAG
jgi:hypothetical protein